MGIFRFIRTCRINGNLGGARVTASKISFVFLWIYFALMSLSCALNSGFLSLASSPYSALICLDMQRDNENTGNERMCYVSSLCLPFHPPSVKSRWSSIPTVDHPDQMSGS